MPKEIYSKDDVDSLITELKSEIQESKRTIETGNFTTYNYEEDRNHIRSSSESKVKLSIKQEFDQKFKTKPEVFFTPLLVDVATGKDSTIRYAFENLEVNTKGFSVDIITWHKSNIWQLKVKWLAIEL